MTSSRADRLHLGWQYSTPQPEPEPPPAATGEAKQ